LALPLVIAHRGASFDLPENTLPAFERAIELGADYVEFDVHADRDGRLVVTHDAPTNTVLEGPRLEEVLDLCRGRIGTMVELKTPARYRRFDVVRRTLDLLDDDAVVLCFQRPPLEEVRRLRPAVRTMQHVGFGVPIRGAAGAWAAGFRDDRVTPRGLAAARRLGPETAVYTVNEPSRMDELYALGVTGIFTDRPDLAVARRSLARPVPARPESAPPPRPRG
jgi:glycerophosphoryl diester phosphodiesterase